jgi:hypothetical protein
LSEEEKITTSIKMLSEIQKVATSAKGKKITLEVNNFANQPFKVVTRPGGLVADWGIGGVNQTPIDTGRPADKIIKKTRVVK